MEAVEAVLAILDQFKNKKETPPFPDVSAAGAPAPPPPAAGVPTGLPGPRPPMAARTPAVSPAQVPDSLIPFAGADPRSIVRAIVAAEVLAPPLALRDEA